MNRRIPVFKRKLLIKELYGFIVDYLPMVLVRQTERRTAMCE